MIKVEHIFKQYGANESKVVALNDVSMEVKDNEFVSIIGPSGSGKSTLLNIISGIDNPTKGKILINDKDIYSLSEKEISKFRRQHFGFIFQSFNLLPTLTVAENIKMPVLLDKKKVDKSYYDKIVDMLGIEDRQTHMPHELSGGQQQRVAIARALITKPDVIFADEPTGNLDTKTTNFVMDILSNMIKQFGTTLVMITHNPDIADIANRKLSITDGVLTEVY
ncbi:MAG: peptide ABC transporter ATP-binding protein [Epulopiscium sp. Nele67-Bin002]|nr:MAG: peptide ABC transporter ATP-binding protein [Epulopiscium sp. Nuni2H_MBin001]OON90650.1 MAG: peptide ABC transporter ATP-binding protein [Epulopiscium sp. Nele67-Bin001]OON92606.1 MAG: peptide ABC transporter ATP-binding protein [Epulopiscium sp. Nele67-Bin002]